MKEQLGLEGNEQKRPYLASGDCVAELDFPKKEVCGLPVSIAF